MSEWTGTMEEAIREAYAAAPVDTVVLHTLEIRHRTLPVPARIVRWPIEGPEPAVFHCLIEEDADVDAGKTVPFYGVPFDLRLPEKGEDTPGEFELSIAGAGYELEPALEKAALGGGEITAVYRSYIQGEEAQGPTEVWPDICLHSPSVDSGTGTIKIKGSILDWLNRKYGRLITPGAYPALVGRN